MTWLELGGRGVLQVLTCFHSTHGILEGGNPVWSLKKRDKLRWGVCCIDCGLNYSTRRNFRISTEASRTRREVRFMAFEILVKVLRVKTGLSKMSYLADFAA